MGALGVLAPAALQLVALRAENMGGDLRVAMTMCREPLLRAFMAFARTHALPPLPLAVAQVAPVVAELVDDTRALISGLTALQKQFLAALFAAMAACEPPDARVGGKHSPDAWRHWQTFLRGMRASALILFGSVPPS